MYKLDMIFLSLWYLFFFGYSYLNDTSTNEEANIVFFILKITRNYKIYLKKSFQCLITHLSQKKHFNIKFI